MLPEKYIDRFPARQYQIEAEKKRLFLRFAACFGQFLMGHDMTISYKSLPLKMFEITRYSFRREQRGELVGIRRLRAFTMPDMHTLAQDMNQAVEEFKKQYEASISVLKDIGLDLTDYEVAIRFTKEFFESNQSFIRDLVTIVDKPVLIEMWDERFFYFVLKFEFNFVDNLDKASALSVPFQQLRTSSPGTRLKCFRSAQRRRTRCRSMGGRCSPAVPGSSGAPLPARRSHRASALAATQRRSSRRSTSNVRRIGSTIQR